jgi:gamma-glutamyltranspeptidase/glutathione hydrolase
MSVARPLLGAMVVVCLGGCAGARTGAAPAAALEKQIAWNGSPEQGMELRYRPVVGLRGMIVADDRQAAEWGAQILRQGGNAMDAAAAVGFMLAVTRPQYGSLGGGGFMVFCPNGPRPCHAIDYRERAPKAAARDMFVREGKAVAALSRDGALAAGVPGVPAGLLLAIEKFGRLPRAKILAEPIRAARSGVLVSGSTEAAAQDRWDVMNAEGKRLFGCAVAKDGALLPCRPGTKLVQPELAHVLELISARGTSGFYHGEVAKRIAAGIRQGGGIMTEQDLADYRPVQREPWRGKFRGYEVVTMPPPSAGGTGLLQMLRYAELAEGEFAEGALSARSIHAMTYAMSLAFADRARAFGDPDHVRVPVAKLLDPEYLAGKWRSFDAGRAKVAEESAVPAPEPVHTTLFSVIDAEGNAVGVTTTVNDNFGSAFVPPGTGVVMNDEMDDFSAQPGVPNLFGLVGAEANAVAGGKRPLSSMSPTIVRDLKGNNRIVLGAQGGPRITTAVFQVLMNRLQFGMPLTDAVIAPRFHHQWKPEALMLERYGLPADVRTRLSAMGYQLKEMVAGARTAAVERFPENGRVWGAWDPRTEGGAVAE